MNRKLINKFLISQIKHSPYSYDVCLQLQIYPQSKFTVTCLLNIITAILFNLSSVIVDLIHVLRRRSPEILLSQVHVVTGMVASILTASCMDGNKLLSVCFNSSGRLVGKIILKFSHFTSTYQAVRTNY